jgi:malate dehydrogenase (oxaloacetate-decarboxylating)(NADP+)
MQQNTALATPCTPRGLTLLKDLALNKGTAFSAEERSRYGLEGLLPLSSKKLDGQVERVLGPLEAKPTDLERYIYLIGLEDRNGTLFYRAVMSDLARFIPILYDPIVAEACLAFGHIYRRARGMSVGPGAGGAGRRVHSGGAGGLRRSSASSGVASGHRARPHLACGF